MGLCVVLEDEVGQALETVTDGRNILHELLSSSMDGAYALLGSIDWYGDTVFNRLQIDRFVDEWDRLLRTTVSADAQTLAAQIRDMALRCRDGVHLYLKFIGD